MSPRQYREHATDLFSEAAELCVQDSQVQFDHQQELVKRAESLGIDVGEHLCGCEFCLRTSILCTATLSSLEMAIAEASKL